MIYKEKAIHIDIFTFLCSWLNSFFFFFLYFILMMCQNPPGNFLIITLYGTDHVYVNDFWYNFISLKKNKMSSMSTSSNESFI